MTKLLLSSCCFFFLFFQALVASAAFSVGHRHRFILLGSFSVAQAATQSVSLAWNVDSDPSVVGYNVNYGTSSGSYTQTLNAGSPLRPPSPTWLLVKPTILSSPPAMPLLRTAWSPIKSLCHHRGSYPHPDSSFPYAFAHS